jgi:hypothetical protein
MINLTQAQFFNIINECDEENPFKNGIHTLSVLDIKKLENKLVKIEENINFDYKKIGMENIQILSCDAKSKLVFSFKHENEYVIVYTFNFGVYGSSSALKVKDVSLIFEATQELSFLSEIQDDLYLLLTWHEKEQLEKNRKQLPLSLSKKQNKL